jgi:hypothetical protein
MILIDLVSENETVKCPQNQGKNGDGRRLFFIPAMLSAHSPGRSRFGAISPAFFCRQPPVYCSEMPVT